MQVPTARVNIGRDGPLPSKGGPGGHPPVAHFGSLWITLGHVESFFSPNVSHVGPCPVSNHEDLQRPRRCLSAPSVEVMADMA